MMLAPASLPWLARHELTLAWRDWVAMMTGGRGLGFIVDARQCREFALSVDADRPRLVVQCFDASMTLLSGADGPLVRASGMSLSYVEGPRWWQGNADLSDEDLTRLQVVRLDPRVAHAIIGVARVSEDYEVRAMRISCDPAFSPAVLYGLPDLPVGTRELVAETGWTPGEIPGNGSVQIRVPLTGFRPGDFVQAAFSLPTSGVMFLAGYSHTVDHVGHVAVTAWNRTAAPVTLGAGTVRVRAVKA